MTRRTQNILYHTLPVAIWLLAGVGCVLPRVFSPSLREQIGVAAYYVPAAWTFLAVFLIGRLRRHADSVEECFWMGLFLGLAGCWMPAAVLLLLPMWAYLEFQNIFSRRSLLSSLVGLGLVVIWVAVLVYLGIMQNPLSLGEGQGVAFFAIRPWAWIPTGCMLVAYMASTIARRNLRVR
ncbi:MAG: hypothetical protein IJ204_06695 [Paludibacteraceae bacterium]|nr:hypothetical protein [Paludibacteraceae bacterium]